MTTWNKAISSCPERKEVLLKDADGTVRVGEKFGEAVFNSSLDFGDCSASFYYPADNLPIEWAEIPQ